MNIQIILASFVWLLAETAYFGWNFWPASQMELICDGIGVFVFVIGVIVPPREYLR